MKSINNSTKIAVFASFSGMGGAERMIVNLCEGLTELGCEVDLLLVKAKSTHLSSLPPQVNVVPLGSSHTLSSLPALTRYLRKVQPDALLAAKDRANQVAVMARVFSGVPVRLVLRFGTTLSASLTGKSRLKAWLWHVRIRLTYPMADGIVAVSGGVAADLSKITSLPIDHFDVIPNPVVSPKLEALSKNPVDHPWFRDGQLPVILGAGRLTRQKDFPTLIRAFRRVRSRIPCRLVILGEGQDRTILESLSSSLGLGGDVDLPGYVENPYPYMAGSALFVLSSAWEGSPNSLTEALALGIPVVSTDCPSGPREILEDGRYGPLVPAGNPTALSEAILQTLANPPDKALLKKAVAGYTVAASSRQYLDILVGGLSSQNK